MAFLRFLVNDPATLCESRGRGALVFQAREADWCVTATFAARAFNATPSASGLDDLTPDELRRKAASVAVSQATFIDSRVCV